MATSEDSTKSDDKVHAGKKEKKKESIKGLIGAVLIALTIRWAFFEAYVIPSGSMLPTLLINDHIFVNKLIYGVRIPFSSDWLVHFREPKRGEVVVFKDPRDQSTMLIKRVIGVPGDTILYRDDVLYVNGKKIEDDPDNDHWALDMIKDQDLENAREDHVQLTEELGQTPHAILHRNGLYDRDFGPEVVPAGHLYMMGDHRDNSADSRYWGFAPIDNVVGRATFVWLSCSDTIPVINMGCNPLTIHWSRFFHWIK